MAQVEVICPACGGALRSGIENLACVSCREQFAIVQGIPALQWPVAAPDRITDRVKAFYERYPFPSYDADDSPSTLARKAAVSVFGRLLNAQIPADANVLEVGCGTGQLTNFLSSNGRNICGTDLCLTSLRLGQAFKERFGLASARFVQMNLFRPAVPAASFDYVISLGVLHHTPDAAAAFRSIANLAKPGGYVIVGVYSAFSRCWTDLRRAVFRVTGKRAAFLDPYLRRRDIDAVKKAAWWADQYEHPHETKHTADDVLRWFADERVEFISAVPSLSPLQPVTRNEALFRKHPVGSQFTRLLAQLGTVLKRDNGGGYFVMIGRRLPAADPTAE